MPLSAADKLLSWWKVYYAEHILSMLVKLILEKGGRRGQTFQLRRAVTILGRRRGCKLRVPSQSVSRRHCRLICRDDFVTVDDLASVNGTRVNGQLIAKRTILHPGDRLTIGSVTFLVHYQLTPRAIERLLDEQQREAELLPTFDARDSSIPEALSEIEEKPTLRKRFKK
jgi:pSer/pThr/pTyr-binding forkhead associated (FHA) protein